MRLFGFEVTRLKGQVMSAVNSVRGWYSLVKESFGGAFQAGLVVDSQRDILSFSGVFAPLTLIASDISKLRPKLVVEDENGICTEAKNVPHQAVLRKPNKFQNIIQFIEQWIISKLLYGNTYVLKQRDARGIVTAMYILDAQRVTPLVTQGGDVYYQLSSDHLSGLGEGVTVPASEIIHDRWNCLWHPLVGISPLYAAGMSATLGRKIQSNSAKFFANMSRPSGVLTAPGEISEETANRLKEAWDTNFSGENIGRTAVLGDDLKYSAMSIPAEQSQLIEQLEWSVRDTASCFHMPLFKVGGPVPVGHTVLALNQQYYSDCLQILIESAELCLDEGLSLAADRHVEFDLDGLMRMDPVAQYTAFAEAVKGSLMKPNEARRRLNLPPLAGGDTIYMQQQNYSLSALAKRDAQPDPFAGSKPAAATKEPVEPDQPDATKDLADALIAKFTEAAYA